MAKRKSRRRSRKSFSILNALESLTYAELLSRGITGGGIGQFLTGKGDLVSTATYDSGAGSYMDVVTGADAISLMDIVQSPSLATSTMAINLQNNIIPMAVGAATTAVTFNVGKRLLRRPISNINRNLVRPLLGAGIRL